MSSLNAVQEIDVVTAAYYRGITEGIIYGVDAKNPFLFIDSNYLSLVVDAWYRGYDLARRYLPS